MTTMTAGSNVRPVEMSDVAKRLLYGVSGGALAVYGTRQRGLLGTAMTLVGSALVARSLAPGLTRRLKTTLTTTLTTTLAPQKLLSAGQAGDAAVAAGAHIERAVLLTSDPFEVYEAWRDFERLPTILQHIESVTPIDERTSHWQARVVGGVVIEWDAEITEDVPGELLCWRSLPGSPIEMLGALRFEPALNVLGGTVLRVDMRYQPAVGGLPARALAKVVNKAVVEEVKEDLRRFKARLEAGEVPTTEGQPRGGPQKKKSSTRMDAAGQDAAGQDAAGPGTAGQGTAGQVGGKS